MMSALRYAAVGSGAVVGFLAAGPAGAAVGAIVGLLVTGGGSSSAGPSPSPSPSPEPTPAPEMTPTGPKTRIIASDTAYPSTFAAKYSGDGNRWKELTAVNPGLHVVYLHWDPESDKEAGWFTSPPSYIPAGKVQEEGLSPWAIGQTVTLPDSWPG